MVKLFVVLWLLSASSVQAECRQALALGLDVSGSVDKREYRLQLDGLAGALQNDAVRAALLAMPNAPVSLAVFEWSGPEDQHLIIGWTAITGQDVLENFAARLQTTQRKVAAPSTAIGSSMAYGAALLKDQSDCWSRTLDLTGDGPSNSGPRPRDVRLRNQFDNITVNALVIGSDEPQNSNRQSTQINELTQYFESEVIVGTGAFVEQAQGFKQFQAAMVRKLLRELEGLTISQLGYLSKYTGFDHSNTAPFGVATH